ncbi:aminopeptidase Y [Zopfochytrium polystomum]|nr:aminopeptidase Y [Zopfochytrium polystomum]
MINRVTQHMSSSQSRPSTGNGSAGNSGETQPLLRVPELPETVIQQRSALRRGIAAVAAALAVAALVFAALHYIPLFLAPPSLVREVAEPRLVAHLRAFTDVAASDPTYGNSRAVLRGYNASADYIVDQLAKHTDYKVSVQPFQLPYFENVRPPALAYAGSTASLVPGRDFDTISNSGSGSLVDARLATVPDGCRPEDFSAFPTGAVALLVREPAAETVAAQLQMPPSLQCTYRTKITNALRAGAAGVLLYSRLPTDGVVLGRAGPDASSLPILGLTHAIALDLLAKLATQKKVAVTLETDVHFRNVTTLNVIADTPEGREEDTVVLGSHLDSVVYGPGVNDDASGASATLEVALSLYRTGLSKKVVNRVRFAWWSAEELGLIGSTYYVQNLAKTNRAELDKIALNLNNDMIASPNGVRFIYNGLAAENKTLRGPSGKIQKIYEDFFDGVDQTHDLTAFDGRSDYGEFLKFGIPAGGLFAGAEGIKTEDQAARFGGTAGAPYDACYHLACDTLENIGASGIDLFVDLSKAIAHSVEVLAFKKDLRTFLWGELVR